MNGAQALIRTLVDCGVDVCFTNPGTSEMHFVAALDAVPEMRGVLALFEGVATGAADGYARMADSPPATLLHLGPGLGNGLANLHNARKGHVPIVNIVGDHATYHKQYDAQLESDIETVARNVSGWIRTSQRPEQAGADAAEAVAAAFGPPGPGRHADPAGRRVLARRRCRRASRVAAQARATVDDDVDRGDRQGAAQRRARRAPPRRQRAARAPLSSPRAASPTRPAPSCSARPSRPGSSAAPACPPITRLAYLAEFAAHAARRACGTSCSSTPSRRCRSSPTRARRATSCPRAARSTCSRRADRTPSARSKRWPSAVGAPTDGATLQPAARPELPTGALTAEAVARALGALLPEGAIVSDEAQHVGPHPRRSTAGAPRHDWLCLTGGAIGQGLPVATGAAVACPDRKVICLEADGSALYTIQSLWTHGARGARRHHRPLQQPLATPCSTWS